MYFSGIFCVLNLKSLDSFQDVSLQLGYHLALSFMIRVLVTSAYKFILSFRFSFNPR